MNYKVFAQTKSYEMDVSKTEEFNNIEEATDYYRDTFKHQAEDISDFGGEHTIMLYGVSESGAIKIVKRNTISTTLNIMSDELQHA